MKGLYPTLFPGGRSVTRIPFTQSESAPASQSLPLGLSAQLSRTAVLWAPLSSVLPPLQPLLCSPAALQPCHHVTPRAVGRALYRESTAMHCPQVCSEPATQGQVRILATAPLILPTLLQKLFTSLESWSVSSIPRASLVSSLTLLPLLPRLPLIAAGKAFHFKDSGDYIGLTQIIHENLPFTTSAEPLLSKVTHSQVQSGGC